MEIAISGAEISRLAVACELYEKNELTTFEPTTGGCGTRSVDPIESRRKKKGKQA